MPKPLDFKEFTGKVQVKDPDGTEWDNETTVRAHQVTEETANRVVNTRTGNYTTQRGDVLVETDRPDVYDVLTEDQWRETDYSTAATPTPENTQETDRENGQDLFPTPDDTNDRNTVRELPGDDNR